MSSSATQTDLSRRSLLRGGSVLILGIVLPVRGARAAPTTSGQLRPNAFVRIDGESRVTVIIKHVEFGQGIATGLATVLADELDADWSQIGIEFAPNNDALYKNLRMGTMATGGSTGMLNSWMQMRTAGAAARAMLVEAAARTWHVPASAVTVDRGVVRAGKHRAAFGDLVALAATLPQPAEPVLKTPDRFTLIGKQLPRLDSASKSDGSAIFAMDVVVPDMVHAAILHPPLFGAKVGSFDGDAALAIPGVLKVAAVPSGVVVYATSFPAALKGRAALSVQWDKSGAETRSSAELFAQTEKLAATPGHMVVEKADVAAALATVPDVVEASYHFPYLAHAPMEPYACVMRVKDGGLELWMGSQFQSRDTAAVAEELGIAPDRALLHECYAGGSFGRRATIGCEFAHEAGQVMRAWHVEGGRPEPVKFLWTREDDMTGGFYRPLMVHRIRGAAGKDGRIIGWDHVIAGQSFVYGSLFSAGAEKAGFDRVMVEGSNDAGYAFEAHRLGVHVLKAGVPTNWWRSVGYSHNSYAVEAFLDELFAKAGVDPVAGRLANLPDPRARAVVERVAAISGWGAPLTEGRARGVAYAKSFGTYVAQVVDVSRGADGLPRVHKVWCAVDCGIAVNPDIIRAQIEGGIGFALGHTLYGEIVLGEGGVVMESNFDSYRSLRMADMPDVEVAIIASGESPTGIGEPGVPPLGPAVANAWRVLTGTAVRRLPFARTAQEKRT